MNIAPHQIIVVVSHVNAKMDSFLTKLPNNAYRIHLMIRIALQAALAQVIVTVGHALKE